MIKFENISKSFTNTKVLRKINFEIDKGEIIVIIGPSGTGKSTLLRCLNRLEIADSGSIDFGDKKYNLHNLSNKSDIELRKRSTMVFQNYNLYKNKTAIENIMEPLITVHKVEYKKAKEIAEDLLHQVSLYDKKDSYPLQLSGGQQQRIAIARAVAPNPDLILFDEPTSALDPELVEYVLSTIKKLASKNLSMIIVTHEMKFAYEVADKIIFLDDGLIVEQGEPRYIFSNSKNDRMKSFLKINN